MAEKKSKYFHHIQDLPLIMLTEKSRSRMVTGQNALISFIENPPGCVFPLHSHPPQHPFGHLWKHHRHVSRPAFLGRVPPWFFDGHRFDDDRICGFGP